jgi:hypothetical protein
MKSAPISPSAVGYGNIIKWRQQMNIPENVFKAMRGIVATFYEEEAIGFAEEYLEDDERPPIKILEDFALAHGNNSFAELVILKRWLESQPTMRRCCGKG